MGPLSRLLNNEYIGIVTIYLVIFGILAIFLYSILSSPPTTANLIMLYCVIGLFIAEIGGIIEGLILIFIQNRNESRDDENE